MRIPISADRNCISQSLFERLFDAGIQLETGNGVGISDKPMPFHDKMAA
ncbi:MAG: transposase [Bacteroides sp.]|nr:transposase [Roseburia sp.]MCM1345466.1 transposase [Bacteroides sp.]MCM1419976.1 transposase [Bacteroides sp.]